MRALLIEDDGAMAQSIVLMLKSHDISVLAVELGETGVEYATGGDYDVILLDLTLPDMHGFDVLRSLRLAEINTPIVILSGHSSTQDKVQGLGYGADDYLTKPFHKDELSARIKAVVRRSQEHFETVIRIGDLAVNVDEKTVSLAGRRIPLTGKEYHILELLAARQGTTMTKEMLLSSLYGGMDEPQMKIIDVFICKLRKKLFEASGGRDFIETVWGRGYVLRAPTNQAMAS